MENNFRNYFVRKFKNLEMYPYIEDILSKIDYEIETNLFKNKSYLIFDLPPRHLKTELFCKYLPSYLYSKNDKINICVVGTNNYSSENIFREFKILSKIKLRENFSCTNLNFNSYSNLSLLNKAKYDLIITDDFINDEHKLNNKLIRDSMKQCLNQLIRKHMKKGGIFIHVGSRWSLNDNTAYLMTKFKKLEWKHLIYKAIDDDGKFLSNRFDYQLLKDNIHKTFWSALYQQSPMY